MGRGEGVNIFHYRITTNYQSSSMGETDKYQQVYQEESV